MNLCHHPGCNRGGAYRVLRNGFPVYVCGLHRGTERPTDPDPDYDIPTELLVRISDQDGNDIFLQSYDGNVTYNDEERDLLLNDIRLALTLM